jgi:hypothetical protein
MAYLLRGAADGAGAGEEAADGDGLGDFGEAEPAEAARVVAAAGPTAVPAVFFMVPSVLRRNLAAPQAPNTGYDAMA